MGIRKRGRKGVCEVGKDPFQFQKGSVCEIQECSLEEVEGAGSEGKSGAHRRQHQLATDLIKQSERCT